MRDQIMHPVSPVTTPTMYCRKCGYVLDGLPENRCPECGSPFNPLDQATFLDRPVRSIPPWIKTLVVVLGLPAFGVLVVVTRGWAAPLCPFLILVSAVVQRDRQNRRLLMRPATIAATAVLAAELHCIWLAYYTLGEVDQLVCVGLYILNIVPCVLWLFEYRRAAITLLLIVALPLIPPQAVLGVRLWRLHREVNQIAAYVEGIKRKEGRPPPDLSGYTYSWPSLQTHVQYSTEGDRDSYFITYWVVQPGISYWYDEVTGWGYYPD